MPRDKRDVISNLKKKGFVDSKQTHHDYLTYKTNEGKISSVYTYTRGINQWKKGQNLTHVFSVRFVLKFECTYNILYLQ